MQLNIAFKIRLYSSLKFFRLKVRKGNGKIIKVESAQYSETSL